MAAILNPQPKETPQRRAELQREIPETQQEKTRAQLEQLKPEFKEFTLYGIKILREKNPENNRITFYEGTKDKPIPNLSEWVRNKLTETEKQKIEQALKQYEGLFNQLNLTASQKQERLTALKDKCFQLHREGRTPQKLEEIPANISLLLQKQSPAKFLVDAAAEQLTVPYADVIPPEVSTIIITREDPETKEKKQTVCVRYGAKGNEHFVDAQTGTPIHLEPNDIVDIAAVTTAPTAVAAANTAAEDIKRAPASTAGTGAVYGGGAPSNVPAETGGGAPAYVPAETGGGREAAPSGPPETRGSTPNQPTNPDQPSTPNQPTTPDQPRATDESPRMTPQQISEASRQTKETAENYPEGDFNVRKIENPEFNGGRTVHLCTFPKNLDSAKKTRFILYLHGFGGDPAEKARDMLGNRETTGGLNKLSKDNNENIVFVIPAGEGEKTGDSKERSYWRETGAGRNNLENFVNYCVQEAFKGQNPPEETKVDRYLMGHSGANFGMERIIKNAPANYFKGIALLDTLYGTGTGEKFGELLSRTHTQTNVYSVYRQSSSLNQPGGNNPRLQAAMQAKTEGPKGRFEVTSSTHDALKYPAVPDALKFFAESEKQAESASAQNVA